MGHSDNHHEEPATPSEPLPPLRLVAEYTAKGHEVDLTPDTNLFGMLGALSVVLVLVAFGVWQLFLGHSDNVLAEAANKPSPLVQAQVAKDQMYFGTYGKATPEEDVTTIRVPVPEAKKLVLQDKARFAPTTPPAGWVHPDDIAR